MNYLVTFFYLFTLSILRINGVEERKWKLSREDVAEIEKQLPLQNNYTVLKTMRTRHGDIYNCVNFYEQPAFDHPSLKNHNFTIQGLNGGGCPVGTVPIKRDTKENLIKAKLAQVNGDNIGYARCSTRENVGYTGVSASLTAYNPEIDGNNKYSAAVIKLHFGPDSIEAGWRVDPQLFQDNKTHFYIHTDTSIARCFNTQCPGFVVTGSRIPLGFVIDKVSTPGGEIWGFDLSITNDGAGGWLLSFTGIEVGRWPVALFQSPNSANYVEWGGEVFSPSGFEMPPMGGGRTVFEDTEYDAYFSNVKVQNGPSPGGPSVDPANLICKASSQFYKAKDEGNVGVGLQYLIFYGGPAVGVN